MSHGPYYLVGCKCKKCKKYREEHIMGANGKYPFEEKENGKNMVIVPFSEIVKCGKLNAKHYISGEHERVCLKKRLKA